MCACFACLLLMRCMHACLGIACSAVRLERVLCVLHVSAVVCKSSVLACVHTVGRACAVCRVSAMRAVLVWHASGMLFSFLELMWWICLSVPVVGHGTRGMPGGGASVGRCVCAMQRMLCYVML